MSLCTPAQCPGHRFPHKQRIKALPKGTAPRCVFCNTPAFIPGDARQDYGARFIA